MALDENDQTLKKESGSVSQTTNNQMEILSVINGLKAFDEDNGVNFVVYSDSQYVVKAFNEGWLKGWLNKGWKTAAKKPVKNKDLWEELWHISESKDISWKWVKAHAGNLFNELVDIMAREAATSQKNSI